MPINKARRDANRAPLRDGLTRQRIIDRFRLGESQHAGDLWIDLCRDEQGMEDFCLDRFNHVQAHLDELYEGNVVGDDSLAAVHWWAAVMCHLEHKTRRTLTDILAAARARRGRRDDEPRLPFEGKE